MERDKTRLTFLGSQITTAGKVMYYVNAYVQVQCMIKVEGRRLLCCQQETEKKKKLISFTRPPRGTFAPLALLNWHSTFAA